VVRLHIALVSSMILTAGCASTVRLSDLPSDAAVDVVLDANVRTYQPGRHLKFFVDVTNLTDRTLDLADFRVELQARGPKGDVQLRQDWTYRWDRTMVLLPEKRLTVPIVPERGLEFPLEILAQGSYDIVAVVNDRYTSKPYQLRVLRPELLGSPRRE
jgi:hypothetical protein